MITVVPAGIINLLNNESGDELIWDFNIIRKKFAIKVISEPKRKWIN